jgi:dTDP-4-dehydrorhamnose 3,5-epimerase
MKIEETNLSGLYVIRSDPMQDDRGFFMRTCCEETLRKANLNTDWVQENLSYNKLRGTLRGLHYQQAPCQEIKLVHCVHGKVFDVMVDLRPDSETYKQWYDVELTAENGISVYIPEGFAHGFQTLTDDATVYYHMSQQYKSEFSQGINYSDPSIGINWPMDIINISERDKLLPFLP